MDSGDTLIWRASKGKAVIRLLAGAVFLAILVVLAREAHGWKGWAGVAFVFVTGGWMLWSGLQGLFSDRSLVVSRQGIALTGWVPRTVAWSDVTGISVTDIRGAQLLVVGVRKSTSGMWGMRGLSASGLTRSPYEIQRDIERARARWEGRAPDPAIVPPGSPLEDAAPDRNRVQGMSLAAGGAVIGFLSLLAPHATAPGAPTGSGAPGPLAVGLAALGLIGAVAGLARWFWPTGRPAMPPIFSTLPERFVLGLAVMGGTLAALTLCAATGGG